MKKTLMALGAMACVAAYGGDGGKADGADTFGTEAKEFVGSNGGKLLYRWAQGANAEPDGKYPLVLFFHGAGERGCDNVAQLKHGVKRLLEHLHRTEKGFFLIAGQVPEGRKWAELDWSRLTHTMKAAPSETMALTFELTDKVMREFPVDASRVYVTGLSMGGYGTWDAISRRPDLFAAALPICGGGDTAQAAKFADLPAYVVHGSADDAVPCSCSRDMVAALWKANGSVRYRELFGAGHGVWEAAYGDAEIMKWVFSRRRPALAAPSQVEDLARQAVLCRLEDADAAAKLHPRFAKAFEFLKRKDLATLALGKYPIDGENVYAMVQECQLKNAGAKQRAEFHRRYLDIQMPLSCDEVFGLPVNTADGTGFDEQKDFKLFDADCPLVTVKPGEFVILAPGVAHAPCLTRGFRRTIRKVVVKVLY